MKKRSLPSLLIINCFKIITHFLEPQKEMSPVVGLGILEAN